jgi:hypothetical protein
MTSEDRLKRIAEDIEADSGAMPGYLLCNDDAAALRDVLARLERAERLVAYAEAQWALVKDRPDGLTFADVLERHMPNRKGDAR